MTATAHGLRFALCAAAFAALGLLQAPAQPSPPAVAPGLPGTASQPNAPATHESTYPIDLPTTLRLAGARNLDIQIAREALHEAQANRQSAVEQFFPWVTPGVAYHRLDGMAQAVPSGVISDTHFQSYAPGAALTARAALGDAIYNSLAAKQLVAAADQALAAQRQDSVLAAAQGYFDLVKTSALVDVVQEAIRISQDYQQQLHAAVTSGIAFRGDELRVQTQTEQYRIVLEQRRAQARVAGVNLAQVLHLDASVALVLRDTGLVALRLFPTNSLLSTLVQQALHSRPELKQSRAFLAARRATKNGAVYGPWIPSLGAQVFGGGLGGGPDGGPGSFGTEADYMVDLSWRIGPGGLFDVGRIRASQARLAAAQLADAKLKDTVVADVVASLTQIKSTQVQIELAERNLATATETLDLTRQRKQFGVGIVLEDIEAQQALTQARSAYVTALAEFDQAQYALSRAVGTLDPVSPDSNSPPTPSTSPAP
ncbi:MAG: TolC family protein [Verrucomicrobia bacterium]|nr:TolC family protein [Verrucomicrobiota bacterium]